MFIISYPDLHKNIFSKCYTFFTLICITKTQHAIFKREHAMHQRHAKLNMSSRPYAQTQVPFLLLWVLFFSDLERSGWSDKQR